MVDKKMDVQRHNVSERGPWKVLLVTVSRKDFKQSPRGIINIAYTNCQASLQDFCVQADQPTTSISCGLTIMYTVDLINGE